MRRLLIALLATMLLPIVAATNYLEPLGWWTNIGNDEQNTNQVATITSQFNGPSSEERTTDLSSGSAFRPIIADLDGDGNMEIYGSSGNSLRVYTLEPETGALQIADEYDTGHPQAAQHSIANDSVRAVIVAPHGDLIYTYSFNGSDIIIHNTLNVTAGNSTGYATGIVCSSTGPKDLCYFGTSNNNIFEYNVVDNTSDTFNVAYTPTSDLALADIDSDSRLEVGFIGGSTRVCVYDRATEAQEFCSTLSGGQTGHHVSFTQTDGGGFLEVLVAGSTATHSYLSIYNEAGSQLNSATIKNYGSGVSTDVLTPVTGTFTDTSVAQACVADYNSGGEGRYKCFNLSDLGEAFSMDLDIGGPALPPFPMFSADVDNDGYDEFVTNKHVWDPKDGTYFNLTLNTGGYPVFADLDDDSIGEIISQGSSSTWVTFSTGDNLPPTWFGNRTYGASPFSISSPICVGTTITFIAREAGATASHYSNDFENDEERLVSTCGTNATDFEGSFSGAGPTLSCLYDDTGTYTFQVYIQDEANPSDKTQFDSISVFVVNGTSGETCNIVASSDELAGETQAVSETGDITQIEDVQEVIDSFTGQSAFIKGIMVIIFTLAWFVAMTQIGIQSVPVIAFSTFGLWIVFGIIGLLPFVYVMLFAFVAVAILGIGFVIGRGD